MRRDAECQDGILSPTRLPIPPSRPGRILTDAQVSLDGADGVGTSHHVNRMPHRILEMTTRGSNLLAILLLLLTGAVSLTGQDMSSMSAATERSSGCHQHGGAPDPRPVSYRCCQSGHDSAILQAPITSQIDSASVAQASEPSSIGQLVPIHFRLFSLAFSSTDPPGNTPLRV